MLETTFSVGPDALAVLTKARQTLEKMIADSFALQWTDIPDVIRELKGLEIRSEGERDLLDKAA